jgi:uncharacterized repeat protein (TIGR02543 family)
MVCTSIPATVYAEGQNTAQNGDAAVTSGTTAVADTAASEEFAAEAGSSAPADEADTSSSISDTSSQETTSYTITYEANTEDEVTDLPQEAAASGDAVLAKQIPTRDGYVFGGWNTAADGSGTVYQPGDTISLSENVTLFAQWEIEKVAVDTATSGKCGDNLTWNYDADTKTLTISGTGEMYDYSEKDYVDVNKVIKKVTTAPWEMAYRDTSITLKLSSGVTKIGAYAFRSCKGFVGKLTVPDSVTSIGKYAFSSCNFTGDLEIPDNVTDIGESAFEFCDYLTGDLNIPNSVISIGDLAFQYCIGFTGNLTIPNSVKSIGPYAFADCAYLTGSLTIPDSVTSIAMGAFYDCSGLTGNLTIPASASSIGKYAFYNCSGLTGSLTIPESVTDIGDEAFYSCSGFTGSLKIPDRVTTIGNRAFVNCSGLTGSLTIPDGVTSIGEMAFGYCSGLTGNLTIPDSTKNLGAYAFSGCSKLANILITQSAVTLGQNVFSTGYPSDTQMSQIVIYGYAGSTAEAYAKKYDIPFKDARLWPDGVPFTDVTTSMWSYASVQYVAKRGLITGTSASTFSPSSNLTRGQFAAILYRMAGRPAVTYTAKFKDVPDGKYYSAAAMWSSSDSVGVLFGSRNSGSQSVGYYRPLDKITRQEMAAAMFRYAKYKGLDTTVNGDISGYPDVSSVSSWGVAAMKWAVGNGIITGQKKSGVAYLMPKGNATRAECAAIIKRFCEKFGQ